MNDSGWETFAATGKISDYLKYKHIDTDESGDANGDGDFKGDSAS